MVVFNLYAVVLYFLSDTYDYNINIYVPDSVELDEFDENAKPHNHHNSLIL